MGTLKEESMAYEPQKTTKNIADLPEVNTEFQLLDGKSKNKDGEEYQYKYIEFKGEEYRIPGKVLGDLKEILKHNPNLEKIKVARTGTGFDTKYTVIPL